METADSAVKKLDAHIAGYLRSNGIKQSDLANEIGISEVSLSYKRRGIRQFTLAEVCKLADLIGVDLDEIFDENGLNS